MNDEVRLFENKPIRSVWDEQKDEWYFSVVDVVEILTESTDSRHAAKYWNLLKTRLKEEGSQLSTNCGQLKLIAKDGKARLTDVVDIKQLLRIIQSIPSKKAEPFKLWLAEVGRDRIEETIDPELATAELTDTKNPKGLEENKVTSREGGAIAGEARENIEKQTGRPVVTSKTAAELGFVITKLIEKASEEPLTN